MAFAGMSLIVDGVLCDSTSLSVDAGADSGYHLLVVQGYTRQLTDNAFVSSRPFIVGGHHWYLYFYFKDHDEVDFMSVYLYHSQSESVEARFVFSFIDQPELRASMRNRRSQTFQGYSGYGFDLFTNRKVLGRSRHMKDDSFTIRCDVFVVNSNENAEEQGASTIQSQFGNLLLSKDGADITFDVGGVKFSAHRCVLAARSAVFKAQLFGTMDVGATAPSIVKINGIKADVFECLLTFIYTGAMPDFRMNNIIEDDAEQEEVETEGETTWLLQLLEAAERYSLQNLKAICEETLAGRYIRATTVSDILGVVQRTRCSWLKDECMEFINSTKLTSLFTPDGLEQVISSCDPYILKGLLSKFA
jgi:speckle-type POZ protein